jgi:hypothetical protein
MAWYAIYQRVGRAEHVEIKFGFSYPAFFFTWAWALSKQLYFLALLSFIFGSWTIFSVIYYVILIIPPPLFAPAGSGNIFSLNYVPIFLSWALQVALGFFGNEIHRKQLEQSGYRFRMAACYNRNIYSCCGMRIKKLCIMARHGVYSDCIFGALLSLATLWLAVPVFPIK